MHFAIAGRAGLVALGCCAFTQIHAQEPPVAASNQAAADPDAAQGGQPVDILNYRIEGNTVLPRIVVEKAVMPFLGPKRSVADVEAARAALEKAYRDNGYETVGVEIPEQDVRNGVIRLNVVELKIGRLRVTDARHFSPEDIKERLPSLAEGQVPNYKQVSREIAAVNKSADRSITPALRAGDTPGTVDVDLGVEDQLPLHGSLELNDRNSSRTKRLRLSASVRYANLFQSEHSLSLQGQMTPQAPEESWIVSGSYVAPIQNTPFTLVAYGVHSDSDVAAINSIGVIGSGDIVGLRGIYSFTSGDALQPIVHQVTAGIDYKSFNENLILGADTAATPIDYFPLTLQYSMAQRTETFDLDVGFALNMGLRGLDATNSEFRFKRWNASASWVTLRTDLSYLRRLPGDWRAGVRLSSQIAGEPLISNEQFSAGGLDSVRGYFESQMLGDDGAYGQLQVDTPSFHRAAGNWMNDIRLFGFVDGAVLRIHDPLDEQVGRTELVSVGGGLNLRALDRLNASVLLAAPLMNKGDAPTDIGNDIRVQFRLWTEF